MTKLCLASSAQYRVSGDFHHELTQDSIIKETVWLGMDSAAPAAAVALPR